MKLTNRPLPECHSKPLAGAQNEASAHRGVGARVGPPLAVELRGARLTLRPAGPRDAREFARLLRQSAPAYRGWIPPLSEKAQFDDYLHRCRREDFFGFLICRNADGALLGNINLFHIILRSLRSGVVGYFVGAPFSRQGYATEALQWLLRFAFKQVKLHRVEANIQPGNAPSLALVRRAGFTREGFSRRYLKLAGRWRDHERWALLAEDWHGLPEPARGGGG